MPFGEIIGQRLALELIEKAIEEKRLAHAYLFLGPEGVGKALLAKKFAQSLNCERGQVGPCEECNSCIKIETRNHPDVKWLTYRIKEKKSDSDDGWIRPNLFEPKRKAEIGIDMIRFLQEAASFKPYEGRTKVFVIDGADRMNEESANCLLKTLEEPPDHTVLILLASNIFRLMPTIISRCQKIPFYSLSEQDVAKELKQLYGLDEKKAQSLSRFSEGSLGRAVEALQGEALKKRDEVVDEFISPKRFGYEDSWIYGERRERINDILEMLAVYCRDLLVFKLSKEKDLLVNLDRSERIEQDSGRYTVTKLEEILEAIADTQERIRRNANIKITLSHLRLNIA